jgi:hypothetical protein
MNFGDIKIGNKFVRIIGYLQEYIKKTETTASIEGSKIDAQLDEGELVFSTNIWLTNADKKGKTLPYRRGKLKGTIIQDFLPGEERQFLINVYGGRLVAEGVKEEDMALLLGE